MNQKQFLTLGGIAFVIIGALGFLGVLGPTAAASIFGDAWWFDNAENWAYLIIGTIAMLVAMWGDICTQKWTTIIIGLAALVATVYGFVSGPNLLTANLENPADNILHLIVAVWALWSARGSE